MYSACSVHVLPDPRRKQAVFTCEAPPGVAVSVDVDAHAVLAEGNTFTVTFDEAIAWSSSEPHLYLATALFTHGDGRTETIEVPFGLREFSVGENRFRINQRPVFLRGASVRGAVDSAGVERLSSLGYNAVRVPFDALSEDVLAMADAKGMLVFATLSSNAPLSEVVSEDAAAFMRAQLNHPSLVAWHVRFRMDSIESTDRIETIQRHLASLRAIDSTRLILCDVIGQDGYPLLSLRMNPNKTRCETAQLARVAVSAPIAHTSIQAALGFGGDSGLVIAEVVRPENVRSDLIDEAVDDVVRALRSNERVAGYWVEDVHDPRPVSPSAIASSIHQPVRPIADLDQRNLWPAGETDARVTLANDSGMSGRMDLSLQVVGPTGQVLWKKKRGMPVPKGGKTIWQGSAGASNKPGLHRFVVRVMSGHRVIAEESVPFHVLPGFEFSKTRVHIVGHGPDVHVRSLSKVVEEIDAPVYVIPPLGNTIWAYPSETVSQILALVQGGAAAIVLAPPTDWDGLTACFDGIPTVRTVRPTFSCGAVSYQTTRHPILEGVRTEDVMSSSYQAIRRNVLLLGETDEVVSRGTIGAFESGGGSIEGLDEDHVNDIIIRSFGEGKVVFVNYDPLAHAKADPAAENLLRNLVDYGASRAVPGSKPPPFQKAIDFWRTRAKTLLHWRVLGPMQSDGKLPAPPSRADDFDDVHDGALGPVTWRDWWAPDEDGCAIDLAEACQPETARAFGSHGFIGYAAHAFRSTIRESKLVTLESRVDARLWFNGRLLGSTADVAKRVVSVEVTTREGLNIVVVEAIADSYDWAFTIDWS